MIRAVNGRQPASPQSHPSGLGVDLDLFDSNVSRLIQLGYSAKGAKNHLLWPLGRMLLHRGDPDLTALTLTDLEDLRRGVDEFTALLREDHVRECPVPEVLAPPQCSGASFLARFHLPCAKRDGTNSWALPLVHRLSCGDASCLAPAPAWCQLPGTDAI